MEYPRCYYRILQYTVVSEDGTRTVHRPNFRKEVINLEAERDLLQTWHRGKIIFAYESIPYGE